MATVPTLETSEVQLNPAKANPDTAAHLGKEVVDVAQGLSGLDEHMKKVEEFSQTQKAKAALNDSYNKKIYPMAQQDQDLETLGNRIDDESQKSIQEAASHIKNSESRNRFIENADTWTAQKDTHIRGIIMSRQTKQSRDNLYNSMESDFKDMKSLPPDQQELKKDQIRKNLQNAEDLGILSPDQKRNIEETQFKKAAIGQVYHDLDVAENSGIHSDNAFNRIKENLNKGGDGLYKDIEDDQVREHLGQVVGERQAKAQKIQETNFKKFQIKNEFDALDATVSGQKKYSTSDISDFVAAGHMSPQLGQAWIRYIQSPKSVDVKGDETGKLKSFSTMADGVFSAWDKEGVRSSMVNILKEGSAGHLSSDEMFLLVKSANKRQKDLNVTDGGKGWGDKIGDAWNNLFNKDSKQADIHKGYEQVKKYTNDASDAKRNQAAYDYLNDVHNDVSPSEAANNAQKGVDGIEEHFPDYKNYPVDGKKKYIPGDGYYKVFPDGTWKKDNE